MSSTARLWSVASYSGSAVWTDITPTQGAPMAPYALADESVGTTLLAALVRLYEEATTTYLTSNDSGATWSYVISALPYVSVRKAARLALLSGFEALIFSDDASATTKDFLGNWAIAIGTVGTIKNAAALL